MWTLVLVWVLVGCVLFWLDCAWLTSWHKACIDSLRRATMLRRKEDAEMELELCTQKLIEASRAALRGLVLATRRGGRWDLVLLSEVSALRAAGEEPVKGYVEDGEFYEAD